MKVILPIVVAILSLAVILLAAAVVRFSRLSRNRLLFIKDCIDLLYVYGRHDAPKLYDRFKQLSHIKQLSRYNITDDMPVRRFRHKWHRLTPAERQLVILMNAGFSNRELSVIFDVGKISSIYVKYYRAKSK